MFRRLLRHLQGELYSTLKTIFMLLINPLNAELNSIYHMLTLLGAHHILHVSGVRVNSFEHMIKVSLKTVQ